MSDIVGQKIATKAQWTWSNPPAGEAPVVVSYPTVPGMPTKTGLSPTDLSNYIQMPLQRFGNPPVPIPDPIVYGWIRDAEDDIEGVTNVRLCQTWIASPPAASNQEVQALNIGVKNGYQQLGVDYDVSDAAYDFFFERAKDEGWLFLRLRWRPVKGVDVADPTGILNATNFTGTKNIAFIYPLLNEFFRIPQTWIVEDQNRGLIRMVPATDVQMLPLFAMQLAFMGFAESVPGGLWLQYTAGLTAADYQSEWNFMRQLVLARSGVTAFKAMQTTVNFGAIETQVQADGLMRRVRYSEKGAFIAQITNLEEEYKRLLKRAKSKGGGFHMGVL